MASLSTAATRFSLVRSVRTNQLLLRSAFNKPTNTGHKFRQISSRKMDRTSTFVERGYILLSIPAITFGLGTWQIHRRKWKLRLIALLEEKTHALPIPFPIDYEKHLKDLEYRRVTVEGTFHHSQQILLGPRSLLKVEEEAGKIRGGLITESGNVGFHVVTPFKLKDLNLTILVNRGWIPSDQKKAYTQSQEVDINSEVVYLTGVFRLTENRPQFSPQNEPRQKIWHYRDLKSMSEHLNTEPVLIDACKDTTVPGGPVGGQTRVSLRNEHLSYIFTWYSLCLATTWMWYTRYGQKFLFK